MDPEDFIDKWRGAELKEWGAYQEHFELNQERAKKQKAAK